MKWTQEEVAILKHNYSIPQEILSNLLPHRTWKAIQLKLFKLGISRGYENRPRFTGPRSDESTRFFIKVTKTETCWIWRGCVLDDGYGQFRNDKKEKLRAHRFAYIKFVGIIPNGHVVHHKCYNKLCVNPEHLETMLHSEHSRLHNLS